MKTRGLVTADRLAPRPHLHPPPGGPGPRRAPLLLPRDGGQLRPRRRHVPPEVAHRVRVVERGHQAGAVVEADLDGGRGRVRGYL